MNDIEVSVVIPVYNTGVILQETIDSVLNQTFDNLELIIIDDGSSDEKTAEILARQNNKKIRIIRQKNSGVAAARNRGVELARGNFIAFLDHDDLFLPEKLAVSLEIFKIHPDAALVYSDTIPFGNYHNRVIAKSQIQGRILPVMIADNPILSMSCSVIRKAFLEQHNIKFNSDCVPCDDWDFHLQCALYGKIYCSDKPLVKYRYHENNLSSNAIKMYYAGLAVINKYQSILTDIAQQAGIARNVLQHNLNYIAFKHHYGLAFEYFNQRKISKFFIHLFKAFFCCPLKCSNRILHFALKTCTRCAAR